MPTNKAASARLADPDEHYPYRHDHVSALIAENGPAGPEGPDDDRATVGDFINQDIADASKTYIEAQAEYLKAPTDVTDGIYRQATEALVAARQRHRRLRVNGTNVVAVRGAN